MIHENTENWPEERYVVESVEKEPGGGWVINSTGGWTFLINASEAEAQPYEPKQQDEVILYGGLGRPVQGIVINGHTFRYKTREQDEAERQEWLADRAREGDERFYANIADWIKRKNALPKPYRDRMNRFINKSGVKEFWTEDGGYELFTLEQSAMMVETAKEGDPINPVAWLEIFRNESWEKQKELMPKLDDGHSGNTFGGAVGLASAVLQGEAI